MIAKSKILTLVFGLIISVSFIWSCAPKPSPTPIIPPAPTTRLKVTVSDVTSGASVAAINAKVQLFKTEADRAARTNPVTAMVTGDANGVVLFDSLSPIDYFLNAYSNDLSKSNGPAGAHTSALTEGVVNTRSIVIK